MLDFQQKSFIFYELLYMSRASIKETEGQLNPNLSSICDTPIKEEYILEKENVGDSRFSSY